MSKIENPQAFPVMNPNYDGNWNKEAYILGMTLRDYFAAKVAQGIVSHLINSDMVDIVIETIAEDSYKVADAMLKERQQ